MLQSRRVDQAAQERIFSKKEQIEQTIRMQVEGRPRAAETEPGRLTARLMTEQSLSAKAAEELAHVLTRKLRGAEIVQGDTIDFAGVFFFDRGRRAARSVARVRVPGGYGTGFMVSRDLFVTNNHVIGSPEVASQSVIEFDYEDLESGGTKASTVFALDPGRFFCTDDETKLDFTLVAVGARRGGSGDLSGYGYCQLSDAGNKHSLGELANIIQHPEGKPKQVVLRENRLAARTEMMLLYTADTMPGSSGSPVFNSDWQVIAIHHYGGPSVHGMLDDRGLPVPNSVNEGVRASSIIGFLKDKAKAGGFKPAELALLREGMNQPVWIESNPASRESRLSSTHPSGPDASGAVTWHNPIEVSLRIPGAGSPSYHSGEPATPAADQTSKAAASAGVSLAAEKFEPDPDYDNRNGYDPSFLGGEKIELPALSSQMEAIAARNRHAKTNDDPFELKYLHYSVVMNAKRRLAFFTACNIDGEHAKNVNRKTGVVTPARPGDQEMFEGFEQSESWYTDPRIGEDEQTPQTLYDSQKTDPNAPGGHLSNIFQRGHLVRRKDPAWGDDDTALAADADTFHFANCTPQIGFFNMGKARRDLPDSGGGKLWRALEDYVLDNAVEEAKRVAVFTGPVFANNDPLWRKSVVPDFRIPLQFWKVVVWRDAGKLRARAMVASQKLVLPKKLPEAMTAEKFADTVPVEDFIVSIAAVEKLTGLSFPAHVRDADLAKGEGAPRRVSRSDELL